MRTPDIEGIANHGGSESCVGIRKDCRRSVDRGTYRPAIEPRNNSFGVPTPSHEAEGHIAEDHGKLPRLDHRNSLGDQPLEWIEKRVAVLGIRVN